MLMLVLILAVLVPNALANHFAVVRSMRLVKMGQNGTVDLRLVVESDDARINAHLGGGDGGIQLYKPTVYGGALEHKNENLKVYVGSVGNRKSNGWTVVTVLSDETLSVVWQSYDDSLTLSAERRSRLDPVWKQKYARSLQQAPEDAYVVHNIGEEESRMHPEGITSSAPELCHSLSTGLQPSEMRSANSPGTVVRPLQTVRDGGEFYPGCFPQDERLHRLDIGLVVDHAYYTALGSTSLAETERRVETMVALSNEIYKRQFNLNKVVTRLIIDAGTKVGIGNLPWPQVASQSRARSTCMDSMGDALESFREWSRGLQQKQQVPHWHLLTGCQYKESTVGLAYVNALSVYPFNVAVTFCGASGTGKDWRVFAHEVGHQAGASHSFENGVGKTGGIMDYGNGKILGTDIYGFRAAKRTNMCSALIGAKERTPAQFALTSTGGGDMPQTCGNGYLDQDEECECIKPGETNCNGCKACSVVDKARACSAKDFFFATPGQPAGGALANPECCNSQGLLSAITTSCNGGQGFCVYGKCLDKCLAHGYALDGCGTMNDGCTHTCRKPGSQETCRPITRFGELVSVATDGTVCGSRSSPGTCFRGECRKQTLPPVPGLPTLSPTKSPTKGPTKSPTKRPTGRPTKFPTSFPTRRPTDAPTSRPTKTPTEQPTGRPTKNPTPRPTRPTKRPTPSPTFRPSKSPTGIPTTTIETTPSPSASPSTLDKPESADGAERRQGGDDSSKSSKIAFPILGAGLLGCIGFAGAVLVVRRKRKQRAQAASGSSIENGGGIQMGTRKKGDRQPVVVAAQPWEPFGFGPQTTSSNATPSSFSTWYPMNQNKNSFY